MFWSIELFGKMIPDFSLVQLVLFVGWTQAVVPRICPGRSTGLRPSRLVGVGRGPLERLSIHQARSRRICVYVLCLWLRERDKEENDE